MKWALSRLRLIVAAVAVATSATLPARGDYLTFDIASHEAMADCVRFESRSWAENAEGEGGRLAANTVWSGGEHVILSDLYIPSGVTLTINAGTVVKFREGTRIKVEDGGSIVLNGELDDEVVLEGYDDDTRFTGIVLQSSSASYTDNNYVIVKGFTFGRYATVSINDTTAFKLGGQALVPVNVSGSRDAPFSFDWVAETNGVPFASGTMNWNRVSDGTKNITIPYPDGLPGCSNFTMRAVTLRCCYAGRGESEVKLSEFITTDIYSHEAMADYIAFESREWAAGMEGDGGRLASNTVWSGTHKIVSDVYIPSGVTLTLSADTIVEFCEGTRIKIEDGGTLNVVGADGHDVIFRGAEGVTSFGAIVKMNSGTFTDNSYVRAEGFTYGAFANVALHDSSTFRSSGLALIPITVSGSRSTAFSIDWVAETNGAPYKTGTLKWGSVSEGTKNLSITYGSELDAYTNFTLRVAVDRACHSSPNTCSVKITDFIISDIATHEAMADYISFESREWAAGLEGEGGRLLSNVTWTSNQTHLVVSDVYIPSGVTLTLTADTVVEFCDGTRLKIEDGGALNIVGAEGHDVIFRGAAGVTNYIGVVKMTNGTYTDNMYVQYPDKPYAAYPNITLHEATTARDKGKMYIPVTVGGTTRNQSFNIDWRTDKGDAGTLTWGSSSDGTKWIVIPIDAEPVGGTTNHVIAITAARACNMSVGEATLTVLEPDYIVKGQVSLAESETDSGDFTINGDIKTQPLFLNDTETIQYSGKWQPYDASDAATLRVTIETDNGVTVLKEVAPSETGAFDLDLTKYPVGYYTLKHEVVNGLGETLATMQKSFSIADYEDVVMHGGVLASNEVWAADKVHVVYQTVVVPSIYTIFIEPGAIVKFMTGTGIDISQGGAFFANRIVFTHINDDTVGGDTLSDGYTVAPPMDAYFLAGAFTFGDDTELRGITQNSALTGTISAQKTLSRGSTYRVSGTLTIASGGSLTIPPGTVLKMESGAAIVVNSGATLNAIGTRAAPIVITSIKDDEYSGDTNKDGGATIPQPGDWEEIKNNGGTVNLAHVTALYGGYGQYSNQGDAIIRTASGETTMDCCEVKYSNLRLIGRTGGTVSAVNCIIEDGRWGVDGAATLVNCVIANCNTGASGATLKNSILWACETYVSGGSAANCVFWGVDGNQPQSIAFDDQSGNIWGDPLFANPKKGDFRIVEGSPCMDAADGAVAPEFDYFGQPRVTITGEPQSSAAETNDVALVGQLADIGICEVMPRDVVSDIDLVPQSVRTVTNAVPGQLLFVKWEIANNGGSEVDASWRDTVSLVSENGREVMLGEKTATSRIAIGGSVFCSAYFTVPAISEGTWYPKVNVNSYHDIFEGSLSANNALVGDRAVVVGLEALDPSISREGEIYGGTPTVLKLAFGENDDNRMVKFDVPAGVRVTWGFGFMPSRTGGSPVQSGSVSGLGSSPVQFRVPDDATDVYVVLESDTTSTYNLSTESTKMTITSVTPATLPSSGTTTLTITGAGFGETNAVILSAATDSYRPQSIAKDASGNLIATVDCATLTAGQSYAVRVESGGNAAELPGAVTVTKVEGKGVLAARLIVSDSARQHRMSVGYVEYENIGNGDMPAPLFIVSSRSRSEKDMVFSLVPNSDLFNPILRIVGIGSCYPQGVLRHGDKFRIPFYYKVVGSNYNITLSIVDEDSELIRESAYSTWKDFCVGMSEAATRVNGMDGNISDYDVIYANAMRKAYGQCVSVVRGRLIDIVSSAPLVGERLYIVDTNLTVWATATTDENGAFRFDDLQDGIAYRIGSYSCQADSDEIVCAEDSVVNETLYGAPFAEVKIAVDGLAQELMNERDTRIALYDRDANETIYCLMQDGYFTVTGLVDGAYSVLGATTGMYCVPSAPDIVVEGGRVTNSVVHIEFVPAGQVEISALDEKTGGPLSSVSYRLAGEDGNTFTSVFDKNGESTIKLPVGEYSFVQTQEVEYDNANPIVVVAGEQTELSVRAKLTPFSVIPSMGVCDLTSVFAVSADSTCGVRNVEWDFDNDGVFDATGFVATNVYVTAGEFDVRLRLTDTDGSTREFLRKKAVETWVGSEFTLADGTVILDEGSGYTITAQEEGCLTLELNWRYLPLALNVGTTVVLPDNMLRPLRIISIEILDKTTAKIYVEAERLESAYRSLRTSIPSSSLKLMKTSLNDINYSGSGTLFSFSYDSDGDSDSKAKKFKKESGGGVAIDAKINGDLCIIVAEGKLERVSWAWGGEASLKLYGSLSVSGRSDKMHRRSYAKSKFEKTIWNQNVVIGVVPANFNVIAYADAKLEGAISWNTSFSYEYKWTRSDGFSEPASSPATQDFYPQIKGSASASIGVKCSGAIGAAAAIGKSEWGAKLLEAGLSIGYGANLSIIRDTNPENEDKISFSMGPEIKGSVELVKASFGPFWSGSLASWEASLKLDGLASVKGEWKTPKPTFALGLSDWDKNTYHVTVSGTSTTSYNKETTSLRTWDWYWDGALDSTGNTAIYKVMPKDKVTHYAILSEQYDYVIPIDWLKWLESYNGVFGKKQGRCKFTLHGGDTDDDEPELEQDKMEGNIPRSCDPNEMVGSLGVGDPETERFVKPGEQLTYTIYFENKADASAAAQEVYVTNNLSQYLDWSTFEMGEVAFGDQIDLGLVRKKNGTSDATMKDTNLIVRTSLSLDEKTGQAVWFLRIVDPTTDTGWPNDILAGFLPPNDPETHCGEGHLTYRINVREDAPAGLVISNSASIVFDYENAIETDPAWWNTVGIYHTPALDLGDDGTTNLLLIAGQAFGELPTPPERKNWTFDGWYTGPNGTGIKATPDAIVPEGDFSLYQNWLVDGAIAKFEECEVLTEEGSNAVVRVYGGNAESAASVKVYLSYNTAASADVDLKAASVGSYPSGLSATSPVSGEELTGAAAGAGEEFVVSATNLKFPLTISWEAGEVGEKVITIPIKTDKAVEDDEFFTLQLADAQGMELGEERVCTVTIHDPGYDDLAAKIAAGTASKAERSAWDKLQKAKAPYIRGLADPADGGKVTGSGLCATGKKVTLKATANKNFTFVGWYAYPSGLSATSPVSGEELSARSAVATTATLVIDRSAKPTASSKTSTTITEVDGDATYFAVFKSDPSVIVSVSATDGGGAEPTGKGTGKYVAGTTTGAGKYAPGKKVTLKAAANKGYVFSRWDWHDETDDGWYILSHEPTLSFAMGEEDFEVEACFVTTEEDAGYEIDLAVNQEWACSNALEDVALWCGVTVDWPVWADALSATAIKVTGLPSGLKLVQDKNTKEYSVQGVPTAASKTDPKTGMLVPSVLTFTVTTAGKNTRTFTKAVIVKPLPQWAYGTFNGVIGHPLGAEYDYAFDGRGTVAMTVAANGKISGKVTVDGTNYTFTASGYADYSYINDDGLDGYLAVDVQAKGGKALLPLVLYGRSESRWLSGDRPDILNGSFSGYSDECGGFEVALWRNLWKDPGNAEELLVWTGAYSYMTADGGALSLVVDEKGDVKVTGTLGKKRKVSLSTALHPECPKYSVDVYVAPSKTDAAYFESLYLANWHEDERPGSGVAYRDAGVLVSADSFDGTGSGTVTTSPKYGQAAAGKTVTMTAKAANDSVFVKWVYEDEDGDEVFEYTPTLKLVAPGHDMSVRAVFAAKENVTPPEPYASEPESGIDAWTHAVVGMAFEGAVLVDDTARPVSFTAKNLPAGLKIDKTTGVISGKPTKSFDGMVSVTATSGANGKVSGTVEIPMKVHAIPDRLRGTFNGFVTDFSKETGNPGWMGLIRGLFSATVADNGSIAVKMSTGFGAVSFKADGWDDVEWDGDRIVFAYATMTGGKGEKLTLTFLGGVNWDERELDGRVSGGIFGETELSVLGDRNEFAKVDGMYAHENMSWFADELVGTWDLYVNDKAETWPEVGLPDDDGLTYPYSHYLSTTGEEGAQPSVRIVVKDDGTATVSGKFLGEKISGTIPIIVGWCNDENDAYGVHFWQKMKDGRECYISFDLRSSRESGHVSVGAEAWLRDFR